MQAGNVIVTIDSTGVFVDIDDHRLSLWASPLKKKTQTMQNFPKLGLLMVCLLGSGLVHPTEIDLVLGRDILGLHNRPRWNSHVSCAYCFLSHTHWLCPVVTPRTRAKFMLWSHVPEHEPISCVVLGKENSRYLQRKSQINEWECKNMTCLKSFPGHWKSQVSVMNKLLHLFRCLILNMNPQMYFWFRWTLFPTSRSRSNSGAIC